MTGGPATAPGLRWYPTNTRLPDGDVLVTGGFIKCCGSTLANLSVEIFRQATSDFNMLVDHASGMQAMAPDQNDYTQVFSLPQPISAGGLARPIAMFGGEGKMLLFTAASGVPAGQRLILPTGGIRPGGAGNSGAGASGALLEDGTILVTGGSQSPMVARSMHIYNPAGDNWRAIDMGISRVHGATVLLPDGTVLVTNGYSLSGGFFGDRRRPQIVDPMTGAVTTFPAWPNDTLERGYHSFALLLKDGNVLVGGGTAQGHHVACERPDVRLFSPPYLSRGPRPTLAATEPVVMTVGGPEVVLPLAGPALRATGGIALMATGSVTHNFDQGQRRIPLAFTTDAGTVRIAPPATSAVAPPGDYILFALSTQGVPSEGVHVRLAP